MKRKNSGITLIALIITIIIMLILAGVTISILSGNDGLLAKAEKAVSETEKAAMQEDAELAIATIKMDYYEDYATNKNMTAKEFIVAKLAEPYKTARGATLVADTEGNITYTLDGVSTKLTIDDNGKVTIGESAGDSGSSGDVTIPEGLEVGDAVTYSPSGTYTWQAEYASSDLAVDGSADVALSSATGEDFNITSWKVFSIDESTGEVELVPSAATTGTVRLQGAQGYNNAVKLLNDACGDLYGDSSKGITARSINRDDLENIMIMYYEEEVIDFVEYYKTTYPPDSYYMDQNYQVTTAYTTSKNYPAIYEQEDLSTITYYGDTEETKVAVGAGLGKSEQTSLIGRTDAGLVSGDASTEGKITTATSIRPYGTDYYLGNSTFTTLLGDYASFVLPSGTSTNYWVASRCVWAGSVGCNFDVASVSVGHMYGGYLFGHYLYSSFGDASYYSRALFPVVSLSASLVSGNDADGWEVE